MVDPAEDPTLKQLKDITAELQRLPTFYADFREQLEAIAAHTASVQTLIPAQTAALTRVTHDVYKNQGQPSRSPDLGSGQARSGKRSGDSSMDDDEDVDLGKDWRKRATIKPGNMGFLHFPNATPSAMDYFDTVSISLANLAKKRQVTLDKRAEAKVADYDVDAEWDKAAKKVGGADNLTDAELDAIQAKGEPQYADTRLGAASNAVAHIKDSYARGKVIMSGLQKGLARTSAMGTYAYQRGYAGGQGPMGLPSLGAIGAGIGQHLNEVGFAFNHDVSPGQASNIYNQLFGLGYFGGQSTDAMRVGAAQMTRQNPMIGQMPEYYQMMDQATRSGTTSIQEFNRVMSQIPDVAKAAHVGLADTVQVMASLGTYNTQIGGTYAGGLQNAVDWQGGTGLPASVMESAMQSSLVQGLTMAQTGLMPQAQGLATPYQHTKAIVDTLQMLSGSIIAPNLTPTRDPITGQITKVDPKQEKAAMIHQFFPDLAPQMLQTLLNNGPGMLNGMAMRGSFDTYFKTGQSALKAGADPDINGPAWQKLLANVPGAKDAKGHHIYEDWQAYDSLRNDGKSRDEAHTIAQRKALSEIHWAGSKDLLHGATGQQLAAALQGSSWGRSLIQTARRTSAGHPGAVFDATLKTAAEGSLTTDQLHDVTDILVKQGHLNPTTLSRAQWDRQSKANSLQDETNRRVGPASGADGQGPRLLIELGPAAKKHFNISDPIAQNKANNGAGSASVNFSPATSGQTAAPFPDPNTAGGWGTANPMYGTSDNPMYGNGSG